MTKASYYLDRIRHAHGAVPSVEPLTIFNRIGVWLCSAHRWKWLERPPAKIPTNQGQEYVHLPDDCVSVITVESTGTLQTFRPTSMSEVLSLRRGIGNTDSAFVYALVYDPVTLARRLELWPAPSSSSVDAIAVHYRAGWTRCTSDDSDVVVPEWLEMLLEAAVVQYTQGIDDEFSATIEQRLGMVRASPLFAEAKDVDGSSQVDLGQMMGGAEEQGYDTQVTMFVPIAQSP